MRRFDIAFAQRIVARRRRPHATPARNRRRRLQGDCGPDQAGQGHLSAARRGCPPAGGGGTSAGVARPPALPGDDDRQPRLGNDDAVADPRDRSGRSSAAERWRPARGSNNGVKRGHLKTPHPPARPSLRGGDADAAIQRSCFFAWLMWRTSSQRMELDCRVGCASSQ